MEGAGPRAGSLMRRYKDQIGGPTKAFSGIKTGFSQNYCEIFLSPKKGALNPKTLNPTIV